MLEVSLLGAETVLRLERDVWSMVKRLRQASNEYPPNPLFMILYYFDILVYRLVWRRLVTAV